MPPKRERLTVKDFKNLPKGTIKRGPYFDVREIESSTLKLGVVVPNSVSKRRVDRNTTRRRVYHGLLEITKGRKTTVIVFLKKGNSSLTKKVIQEELKKLLH